MTRRFRPNRRTFLRSALGGLAIPFLPSAQPRSAWAQDPPAPGRLFYWYVPNGIQMNWWTPSATGAGYDLPTILGALADIQSDVSVLTGLSADAGSDGRAGDHARGTGCFLTATLVKYTEGEDIENGVSVDQVAAQHIGDQTVFPSLELGVEGGTSTGDCDSGYSCAYARNIAWAGPATPLPKVTDPLFAFERLFGADDQGRTPDHLDHIGDQGHESLREHLGDVLHVVRRPRHQTPDRHHVEISHLQRLDVPKDVGSQFAHGVLAGRSHQHLIHVLKPTEHQGGEQVEKRQPDGGWPTPRRFERVGETRIHGLPEPGNDRSGCGCVLRIDRHVDDRHRP